VASIADHSRQKRYATVAIILHWLMAVLIIWQIWIGIWMSSAIDDPASQAAAYEAFQFHKSLGLTLLVLAVLRLLWRVTHGFPELPRDIPAWQRVAARISHYLLYAFILLIPLTGWLYVSTGWNSDTGTAFAVPTVWFGLFEWPHIPGVGGNGPLANLAVEAHELLAWSLIALLVVHVAAALKHHFADRDDVLWSMLPFISRPSRME
jgi:cytochrome b561